MATPSLQHEVMIEAVENHNPEAIVIDEIGRELEAAAARTIAERGRAADRYCSRQYRWKICCSIPTLSDLVGGIESVTLSDEEARRRGTQKTVLERRAPPTFDVLIEIQNRERVAVHSDVAAAVDSLLRGYPLPPEIRERIDGDIRIERAPAPTRPLTSGQQGFRRQTVETPRERYAQQGSPYEGEPGGRFSEPAPPAREAGMGSSRCGFIPTGWRATG